MASRAVQRCMRALERQLRQGVIELCLIELRDVRIAPFVLAVTGAAFAAAGIRHAAVKIAVLAYILGNIFMAIETQRGLRHFVGAVVAIAARLFLLDVSLAHLPRHQQGLDRARMGLGGEERDEHSHAENPYSHERSVNVNGDHMHDPGDQQHEEERNVQHVPEREELRIQLELHRTATGL